MTIPTSRNLDYFCARRSGELVDELKSKIAVKDAVNHVQKSLGVLQEDGLYAFCLYQLYRRERGGKEVAEHIRLFLGEDCAVAEGGGLVPFFDQTPAPETLKEFQTLIKEITGQSLHRLFLARDLIERVLVYVYYHLRSLNKIKEGEGQISGEES